MKRLLILFLGLMLTASLSAQQRIIGLVLTADNEPVVGASVSIEGTTLGTVTDNEGRFEIRADQGARLVVDYMGYATQTVTAEADGSAELRIILQPQDKSKRDKGNNILNNRFATWGQVGMSIQPEAFNNPDRFENYNCVGGGLGIGYQLRYYYFLMTTGVELASINYNCIAADASDSNPKTIDFDCRRLQLQVPVLLGMEMKHWFWQTGVKFGFFNYYYMFNRHRNFKAQVINQPSVFAFAPAFEIGYNETTSKNVNFKVAAFAETYFDMHQSSSSAEEDIYTNPSTQDGFYYLLFGLKFGVAF